VIPSTGAAVSELDGLSKVHYITLHNLSDEEVSAYYQ